MDAAALSLTIDSSSVVKATADLDRFSAASERAAAAAGRPISPTAKAAAEYARVAEKAGAYSSAAMRAAAANDNAANAAARIAAANDSAGRTFAAADAHVVAYSQHLVGLAQAQERATVHIGQADAHVIAYRKSLDQAGQAIKFTARDGLNASRQLADIGVTAAMGMSPFIIALQQGPQLFDILQEKAVATGTSVGAVFRAAGAAIWAALLPLLPLIAAIALAIGTVAAGFALANRAFTEGQGKVVDGLNLTEKQLKKLEKAGVDTGVTIGDTFKAFFVTIGQELSSAFDGPLKGLRDAWKAALDFITDYGVAAIKIVVGTFAGSVAAITATWRMLPGALGDIMIQAANAGIDALNGFLRWVQGVPAAIYDFFAAIPAFFHDLWTKAVNLASNAINWFIGIIPRAVNFIRENWWKLLHIIPYVIYEAANKAIAGISWLINKVIDGVNALGGHLSRADFGQIANPFSGQAAAAADTGSKAFIKAYDGAGAAVDSFGRKWQENAEKIARNRILAKAGEPGKTPKGPKSDAEKFADIVQAAEAEIAVQEARLKAVGMSARAASELEQRTKLLNQIEKAGIPITAAVRSEVDRLAKAYAAAKIAADAAAAIQSVTEGLDKQRLALTDSTALIGLYGDNLIRARNEAEALRKAQDALPKGETLSSADRARIAGGAAKLSDAEIADNRARRMADLKKSAEDSAFVMDRERAGLGLTGEAALRYTYATEQLNRAKQDGITMTPEYVAAIEAAGDAYARQRYAIDKQAEALAGAREVTKGFWLDWINGAREGANVFKSFADSAINALNRVIDKLLDRTLDTFLNGLFSGGTGGFLGRILGGGGSAGGGAAQSAVNALTGAQRASGNFGNLPHFAKGGTFTNTIVNTPTLFRFANGSKLGEMGEAGPEAIMPLKRGPNGALGVQAVGGGRPNVRMGDVALHMHLAGAMMPDTVVAIARQAGEQAVSTIRKDFANIAAEYEANGVVSA